MRVTLVAKLLQGHPKMDLRAVVLLDRRILTTYQTHDLPTLHPDTLLTFLRLADAGFDHIGDVLLFHVVQIQLLNTCNLLIIKPVGRLQVIDL